MPSERVPSDIPCSVSDCGRPAQRSGLCWGHLKRRAKGLSVNAPLTRNGVASSPKQNLLEASLRHADAGDDDVEYERSVELMLHHAETYGRRRTVERIKKSLDALKAAGVKLGRPVSVTAESVAAAMATLKTQVAAARALNVSERTVRRWVKRGQKP